MKTVYLAFLMGAILLFGCNAPQKETTENAEPPLTPSSLDVEAGSSVGSESNQNINTLFSQWLEGVGHPNKEFILADLDKMSMNEIVETIAIKNDVSLDNISIIYHDINEDSYYELNETNEVTAASTVKMITAKIYADLIKSDKLALETKIPYHSDYIQEGTGAITEAAELGTAPENYPLEEVIYELVAHSDNTANVMLHEYYDSLHGEGAIYHALSDETNGLWTYEDVSENTLNASTLDISLIGLMKNKNYDFIIEDMTDSDENIFMKKYVIGEMKTKYGTSYNLSHHVGTYSIDDQPIYDIIIFTNDLDYDQADEFMGQLNLQLATLARYKHDL